MRIVRDSKLLLVMPLLCGALNAQTVTKRTPSGGSVGGATSLTTVGALPRVSAAGTLAESAISDNGTDTVTVTGRNVAIGATILPQHTFDLRIYGASCDTRYVADASATAGQPTITSATANFTAADIGKTITIEDGAPSPTYELMTTIAGVTNSTTATLAANHQYGGTNLDIALGTDDTTALNDAFAAVYAAGGGDIYVPAGTCLIAGDVTIPNSGGGTPIQPPYRLYGAGISFHGTFDTPTYKSGLDLRGLTGYAQLHSTGAGTLEIDHLALMNRTVSGDAQPAILGVTNTNPNIHDVIFWGDRQYSATVDGILLGDAGAQFQGYTAVIERNFFHRIRQCVTWASAANASVVAFNTVGVSSGKPGYSAFVLGSDARGNLLLGNTVEIAHYDYAFVCAAAGCKGNQFIGNSTWDPTEDVLGAYNFDDSLNNLVISAHDDLPSPIGGYMQFGTALPASALILSTDGGVNQIPAVPSWRRYSVVKIANGIGGCANAKGCWSVNGGTAVNAATATSQAITWLTSTAGAALEGVRWKTATACAGITAITLTDMGTTASASEFFTGGTYNLKTAVGATNLLWPLLLTPGATAASTAWTVTISGGVENIDDITDGCAFDIHAKWSVLP